MVVQYGTVLKGKSQGDILRTIVNGILIYIKFLILEYKWTTANDGFYHRMSDLPTIHFAMLGFYLETAKKCLGKASCAWKQQ